MKFFQSVCSIRIKILQQLCRYIDGEIGTGIGIGMKQNNDLFFDFEMSEVLNGKSPLNEELDGKFT